MTPTFWIVILAVTYVGMNTVESVLGTIWEALFGK